MALSGAVIAKTEESSALGDGNTRTSGRAIRLGRMIAAAVGGVVAFVVWEIGRQTDGDAAIGFLSVLQKAYLAGACVVVATTLLARAFILRRKRRQTVPPALARLLLALGATLLGLILAEASAGLWLAWVHRTPTLPTIEAARADASVVLPTKFDAAPGAELNIVVIGESSARGVPYEKWLSVGWRLRQALPDRRVRVEVLAESGKRLEDMPQKLAPLTRRPDLLIIYCGHNEFYALHGWTHEVSPYYLDDPGPVRIQSLGAWFGRVFPLVRLIEETLEKHRVAAPPPRFGRRLIDSPSHSEAERSALLADFQRRMEAILVFCEKVGALPVLVPPPGNDAGFEPARSVLPPETPRARRDVFAQAFEAARRLEASDPSASMAAYRALIIRQPGFAESHFRLARLLEADGQDAEAYDHYVVARDLDGHPLRCLTSFHDVYRSLAARHDSIFVDGQTLFLARHPRGLLDDSLFNDGFHPSFEGHVALAEAILAGLKARKAFGWPDSVPAPKIDLIDCASHFQVGVETWKAVCANSVGFYHLTAPLRFDQTERFAKRDRYNETLHALGDGRNVEDLNVPGIGLRSAWDRGNA